MSVRVKGAAEIEAVLKKLPERLARNVVQAALRAGGTLIAKQAKANLEANGSVDSGFLKSKIGVSGKKGKAQVGVLTGQTIVERGGKMRRARATSYARFIEFGNKNLAAKPFIRPALDEKSVETFRVIGERMGKGVEREARALAGGQKSFMTGKKI